MAIDLTKAFDTVNHEILFEDIVNLPLNSSQWIFLLSYFKAGRLMLSSQAQEKSNKVSNNETSSHQLLFICPSSPPPPPPGMRIVIYANDNTVFKSGPVIGLLCEDKAVHTVQKPSTLFSILEHT